MMLHCLEERVSVAGPPEALERSVCMQSEWKPIRRLLAHVDFLARVAGQSY